MPQSPLNLIASIYAGTARKSLIVDASGVLFTSHGGALSSLNLSAATLIKAGPGRISRLIINAPGTTSGAFTLNDAATIGAAAAANQIWTMAYNAAANVAGAMFLFDFPYVNGLVLSAVPGGGSPVVAISYI